MTETQQQTPASFQIVLADVMLGKFVHLATPRVYKPDANGRIPDPKFEVEVIIEKTHPQLQTLLGLQRGAAQKRWPNDFEAKLITLQAKDKVLLHRGDATRIGDAAYAGKYYFSPKNKEQPTIVVTKNGVNIATRGTPVILTPNDECFPYPGCRCNMQIDVWGYDDSGKQIPPVMGATLMGIQFFKHGKRLAGTRVSSASEFGLVATDADGPSPTAASSGGPESLI